MISLQVVRPALAVDIEKMKADFIHGYRPGAAIFYVSTTDFGGLERVVTDADRQSWDDYGTGAMRSSSTSLGSILSLSHSPTTSSSGTVTIAIRRGPSSFPNATKTTTTGTMSEVYCFEYEGQCCLNIDSHAQHKQGH